MFPTRRSLVDGMSRELFERNSVYIAKQSDSRPMEVESEIQNDSEKQQRASC